jgi:hypothetical protein
MIRSILFLLILSLPALIADASTRRVPVDHSSIQEALNACAAGDTVLVGNGVYPANLQWPQVNGIVLKSENGSEATLLDGSAQGSVISVSVTSSVVAFVDGFTIQNGLVRATSANGFVAGGAGINVLNATLSASNCNFTTNRIAGDVSNFSYGIGSAINGENAKILITGCDFNNNTIDSSYSVYGGVIYGGNSQLSITRSAFHENTITAAGSLQGGVIGVSFGQANLKAVSIYHNSASVTGDGSIVGGACYFSGTGVAQFTNVLIGDNTVTSSLTIQGGGIWSSFSTSLMYTTIAGNHLLSGTGIGGNSISLNSYLSNTPKLKVINSILWNNEASDFELAFVGTPIVTYSDIYNGFTGTGNIALDPMFVSSSDFHLQNSSPCVNRATGANFPVDLEGNQRPMPAGTKADLGCFEINQGTRTSEDEIGDLALSVFPNPMDHAATIAFTMEQEGTVNISVFDFSGRMVKEVAEETFAAGVHRIELNGNDLPSGDYLIQTRQAGQIATSKITVE